MPMEYIVPSLRITAVTGMDDVEALEERIAQLIQLEEDHFIVGFHQHVAKDRQKAWNYHHIKILVQSSKASPQEEAAQGQSLQQ